MSWITSYGADSDDFLYYDGSNDGSVVQFDANCDYLTVANLSDSSFIIFFDDTTDGSLIAASVSDTTPSFGTKVSVTTNDVTNCDIVGLTATSGVVLYDDATASDVMIAGFTVSGTTVTAGTPVQVDATIASNQLSIKKISSTTALAVWSAGTVDIGVVSLSGTTASIGSLGTAGTSATDPTAGVLSSTLGLTAYMESGVGIQASAFTISGTTIGTAGTAVTVGTGGTGSTPIIIPLTSTTAAVVSPNIADDTIEYSLISVSGTTITENFRGVLGTLGRNDIRSSTLNNITALINPVLSSEGGIMGIKQNPSFPSNIIFGKQDRTMNITASNNFDIAMLTNSKVVAVYESGAAGKAIVTKVR